MKWYFIVEITVQLVVSTGLDRSNFLPHIHSGQFLAGVGAVQGEWSVVEGRVISGLRFFILSYSFKGHDYNCFPSVELPISVSDLPNTPLMRVNFLCLGSPYVLSFFSASTWEAKRWSAWSSNGGRWILEARKRTAWFIPWNGSFDGFPFTVS